MWIERVSNHFQHEMSNIDNNEKNNSQSRGLKFSFGPNSCGVGE